MVFDRKVGGELIHSYISGMKMNYTNGDITILWQPDVCIHCGECVKGLPSVFKPRERPWIQMENATSEAISEQVNKCPSGAISIKPTEP